MQDLPLESRQLIERVTALMQAAKERNERSKRLVPCSWDRILWARDLMSEREAVQSAVTAFARKARDDGYPADRMLVLLEDAVRDAGLAGATREVIVHWGMSAYHHAA
jgi:hypothetical protein